MNNKAIAKKFQLLADLMELLDENPFKIRSYQTAYNTLRNLENPLCGLSSEALCKIEGVGAAIADKIIQLCEKGSFSTLDGYLEKTPEGIIQMLQIRGLGPKKIKIIWKQLAIDNPGDLLYACNENRLVEAKGFGEKTQADIKSKLEYYFANKGLYHYGFVIDEALSLVSKINDKYPEIDLVLVGDVAMKRPIVNGIALLCTDDSFLNDETLGILPSDEDSGFGYGDVKLHIHKTIKENFIFEKIRLTSDEVYWNRLNAKSEYYQDELHFYSIQNKIFTLPEHRENDSPTVNIEDLIQVSDIKGVVHAHSKYSDGLHTLEDMAIQSVKLGYEYLVMTDHSQSASYAGGMKLDKLEAQWSEIEMLNEKHPKFKIYKGVESDILINGDLDYPEEILAKFDLVIASIHSVLSMDVVKATDRLIKAIANPYTKILGHPTGRLLLGRPGYPIDHEEVIKACSEYGVAIELNSNPQRLDMDYKWISLAMENNVMISINPDAHSKEQIQYINIGVEMARKGGLLTSMCLNALDKANFETKIRL